MAFPSVEALVSKAVPAGAQRLSSTSERFVAGIPASRRLSFTHSPQAPGIHLAIAETNYLPIFTQRTLRILWGG